MTDTKHTPGTLTVTKTNYTGQYDIQSNYSDLPDGVDFMDAYVNFSGYYGTYGPHVFAAAPDMLEALENLLSELDFTETYPFPSEAKARVAIAKAKGKTE